MGIDQPSTLYTTNSYTPEFMSILKLMHQHYFIAENLTILKIQLNESFHHAPTTDLFILWQFHLGCALLCI